MEELERIVNKDEKHALVFLAEEFELLDNHEKALKYCDMALEIDEDFEDACSPKGNDCNSLKESRMIPDKRLFRQASKDL